MHTVLLHWNIERNVATSTGYTPELGARVSSINVSRKQMLVLLLLSIMLFGLANSSNAADSRISTTGQRLRSTYKQSPLNPAQATIAIDQLRRRSLLLPIVNVDVDSLKGSFFGRRSGHKLHFAADIPAARNSPIMAVDNCVVAKLRTNSVGGHSLFLLDASSHFVYYYAHLESYAAGIREGVHVSKGQVIGFVGTSGNAPKDKPHVHFAIHQAVNPGQWWHGNPIDPWEVYRDTREVRSSEPNGKLKVTTIWTPCIP
jgi:murein DD-endopeptidase MepM/ murein hydrolase activator NlpD